LDRDFAGVEVNDAPNSVTAPVIYPVMSVKWGRVSRECQ
jgi:hypothetical protein